MDDNTSKILQKMSDQLSNSELVNRLSQLDYTSDGTQVISSSIIILKKAITWFYNNGMQVRLSHILDEKNKNDWSVRQLDWFIMKYCKNSRKSKERKFYDLYIIKIAGQGKGSFGSFCRKGDNTSPKVLHNIIFPDSEKTTIVTDHGQLNWFLFVFKSGALAHADKHRTKILSEYSKKSKTDTRCQKLVKV